MSLSPPQTTSMAIFPGDICSSSQCEMLDPGSIAPLTNVVGNSSKAHKRTCSVVGCKNGIVQGGLCVSHGAKRRICRFSGCTKNSKTAGLCSKHGPPRKKCNREGCTNVAVRGGKCKAHGASSFKSQADDVLASSS